jgi:hypothetical protein
VVFLHTPGPEVDRGETPTIGWDHHRSEQGTSGACTVQGNALQPADPTLAAINEPYAHTFILEDSYPNALVNGLAEDIFDSLPNAQSDQRAAIIEWRVRLELLAIRLHVTLPSDLQQAGRGEIAPSVSSAS